MFSIVVERIQNNQDSKLIHNHYQIDYHLRSNQGQTDHNKLIKIIVIMIMIKLNKI